MYQPHTMGGADQQPFAQSSFAQSSFAQPPSIVIAVKLMYAGAVLSAIGVIVQFFGVATEQSLLRRQHPSFTSEQIHSLVVGSIVGITLIGLISIGLWIFMARANGAGKRWARIVASALFALSTLDLVNSVVGLGIQIGLILGVLSWLVGLGAVVLLWRGDSSAYFSAGRIQPG